MVNKRNVNRWLVVSVFLLAMVGTARGQIIYVDTDANGANDGSSWADAYNYLQDALAAAGSGDEVRVAEGIYTPDSNSAIPNGSGDRTATFQLISGVTMEGGYAGFGEPDPNERDPDLYETVLSGDLNGDDGPDFVNNGENSYHVVTGSGTDETAMLDGCTIIAGYSETGTIFLGKTGAGMLNHNGSPVVTNCTFRDNFSAFNAGAISNWNSSIRLIKCSFMDNFAVNDGGAIYNRESNTALVNCTFRNNSTNACGGAMQNFESDTSYSNCLFVENSTARYGGAIFDSSGPTVMTNCTFAGNIASIKGGGIRGHTTTLINCVFWGNGDADGMIESSQIDFGLDSGLVVNYSCIQGWTGIFGGTANIGDNPLFADLNDYRLTEGSPCIDSGDNESLPADSHDLDGDGNTTEPIPWDLDGNRRIVDGNNDGNAVVDMGAYEYFVPPIEIEVEMRFTPRALNPGSKGKWVKAHFVLPEGYTVADVDVNSPAKITEPFEPDIDSNYVDVFINDDNLVEVEAAFERDVFCEADISDEAIEVVVTGSFTSGQQFYGTDTIKVTTNYFKHLGILASYWLEQECDKPDWCEGVDLDQNSVVDFVDFALFDGCCIEVVP